MHENTRGYQPASVSLQYVIIKTHILNTQKQTIKLGPEYGLS